MQESNFSSIIFSFFTPDNAGANIEAFLEAIPIPSMTSTNTRKKRKEELKQATIRQHYYPEGGWGYVVVCVGFLVQIITHGFQMSFGILLLALLRRYGEDKFAGGGKIKKNLVALSVFFPLF